jgi:Fe-S cluster assembly ATP-binding protein
VHLDEDFLKRSVNEGLSGGEKKRSEIAQLLVLKPKYAILDEIDSGLDVDSLKFVARALNTIAKKHNMGMLLITHYQRILHLVKPDFVHVLIDGKIKASGDIKLVEKIEKDGYADI